MEDKIEEQVYLVRFKLLDGGSDATCILCHINNNVHSYVDHNVHSYVDHNVHAYVDNNNYHNHCTTTNNCHDYYRNRQLVGLTRDTAVRRDNFPSNHPGHYGF